MVAGMISASFSLPGGTTFILVSRLSVCHPASYANNTINSIFIQYISVDKYLLEFHCLLNLHQLESYTNNVQNALSVFPAELT